ncbi:hypothetical protein [Terribacillus sp. AE2B 122]|nr:hypothetical protein [Terribacillus sp. AE2B 122]
MFGFQNNNDYYTRNYYTMDSKWLAFSPVAGYAKTSRNRMEE